MTEETMFPEITTKAERHQMQRRPDPEFTYQAMGAGVQSTTIAVLAANGEIEKPKFAVFSDTGWEPQKVYDHLEKLDREVLKPSGIKLFKVKKADLSKDAGSKFAPDLMPLYIRNSETGKLGVTRRQCTSVYKIGPLNRWVRQQLGAETSDKPCKYCGGTGQRHAPWLVAAEETETMGPCWVCAGTGIRHLVGSVPDQGAWARSYIGFSVDEVIRVSDSRDRYVVNHYPLLDLRMSREDCYDYLADQGWGETPKSACIGCPFHTNAEWRKVKADPVQWQSAIEVDERVRHLPGRHGIGYLHSSRVPLAIADISGGGDDELGSCSPYGCRSGDLNFDDQLSLLDEEMQ